MEALGSAHLLDAVAVLRRRRWVVYVSVTAVTLFVLVATFLATPLYRATVSLQIERQTPEILSFTDVAKTDYSWAAYNDFYQTQYKILASEGVARLAVRKENLQENSDLAPGEPEPSLASRIRSWIPGGVATPRKPDPELQAARAVQGGLEISPVRNSHLVLVSWVSPDPHLAAKVANAVAHSYIQFNQQLRFETSEGAEEFLADQIEELKREVQETETELQSYGESKNIVSIDDASNITLKALADISARRTGAQTDLARAEAAYRSVLASPPDALPEVRHSTLIGRLKEEHAGYEAEYSEKSRLFKSEWPGMQTLTSKIEQAKERLELETDTIARQVVLAAETEYRKAQQEVSNLDLLLQRHENAAQDLKRDAVQFANLLTGVKKKRETLDTLIARQNEMALSSRLTMGTTSSNIRIVDEARTPEAPFSPNKKLNLLMGALLGVFLGVGAAFLLDYLDNTIRTPAEIQKIVGLPTLAVVPRHSADSTPARRSWRAGTPAGAEVVELVSQLDGRAAASEAYRELRTALLLSGKGSPPRKILVTSALPEEGKSATAVNLAIVLAQLGRRVLLVDTDLRRPRLHTVFDVDSQRGTSTYLSGLEPDVLSLAQPSGVERLDFVSSGPIPPNPSELLNSPRFVEMGTRCLEDGYDHVVFDSPPTLAVSDPVIIGSMVDAVVLVARAGRTPRQSLRLTVDKLAHAAIRPVGVVLNDLDLDSQGYTHYTYYGRHAHPRERVKERTGRPRAGAV